MKHLGCFGAAMLGVGLVAHFNPPLWACIAIGTVLGLFGGLLDSAVERLR